MVRGAARAVLGGAGALLLLGCQAEAAPGPGAQAGSLVVGCAPVAVFTSGQDGYHTFRIPALVTAAQPGSGGSVLIAFAEGRRHSEADSGDVDVVERRSTDGGCTWSPMERVSDAGTDTVGNPAPVVDGRSGRVVLLTTRNAGTAQEQQIMSGAVSPKDSRRVYVQSSADAGATWSRPREITDQAKLPGWRWYATGPGHGVALTEGPHAGRLVVGADHSDTPPAGSRDTGTEWRYSAGNSLLSDDGGATWRIGYVDPADDDGINVNETAVAQLPDGRLYFAARDQNGRAPGNQAHAWSSDGGASVEAPFRQNTGVTAPMVKASVLQTDDGSGTGPLLMAAPSDARERVGMGVRVSHDGGAGWSAARRLSSAPAAYSDLAQLDRDRVGLLYETGVRSAYESIVFTRLSLPALDG
ncbi:MULTISPECIES: exo-alpha-sialidase [unclassified Streptomyces]|uniref:sialidase family protein n=1 Tax=unclassified Streptomyces TaxID=2593676 RepID=UPI00381746A3